ncbi:MAG: hypothetical protein J6R01_01265 [Alistipes sp.]|nr:hypothetical protein [Alistipes sp.]
MKAKFLALAALLVGMAACQTDPNGLELDRNGEAAVTLNVGLPNGATRAAGADSALGAIDNGIDLVNEYDIRFILEVYDANGELAKDRMVKVGDATEAAFNFRLVPGRDYKFVVWADFVANNSTAETVQDLHYETTNGLRLVAIKDWTAIDESRDAYTAAVDVENYSGASQIKPITLTRPFAKLRVVTNDIKEMITLRPEIVKVNYFDTEFYTAFDAFAENPINQSYTGHELIVDLKEDFYTNENPDENGVEKGVKTLFADYFFAKEGDRVKFNMDVAFNDGSTLPQVIFNTDIPVDRNKLTTIYGSVLTDANNVTVKIEDGFNQPNIDVEWKKASTAQELAEIFEEVAESTTDEETHIVLTGDIDLNDLLGAVTYSTRAASSASITIATGKEVVLDIKGYTITGTDNETASYGMFNIQPGAKLTIEGGDKGKIQLKAENNRGWNAYSSVISNQRGEFVLNGGTIEHLGGTDMAYGLDILTNTGAGDAKATINGGTIKSTYRAVRQFLNSTKATAELVVNGGTIDGRNNKSIWMQNANASVNPGKLVVAENANLYGDVMISGSGASQIEIEASVAKAALGNSQVILSGVPAGYAVVEKNGNLVLEYGIVENGNEVTILNVGGLKLLAAKVNAGDTFEGKTVKLGADIDLNNENWTPIGYWTTFNGTFDGQNHTISNLKHHGTEEDCYVGLFGYTENATIKNLTINNVDLKLVANADWAGGHMGALVGNIEGTTVIENITVKGDVKIDGDMEKKGAGRIGAVVGGNTCNATFKNVVVNANANSFVKGNSSIGGIAGQLQGQISFEDCSSNIDVTAQWSFAGGIIGLAAEHTTFTNCSTSGNIAVVAGREGNDNDLYRVGGIVGSWDDNVRTPMTLVNCESTCVLSGASADGRTATAFDCAGFVGRGYSAVVGAKVVVNGAEYEYAGEGIYKMGDAYVVKTGDALVAALNKKYDVTFGGDLKIDPANMSNAYGKTGVLVYNGQTIDGAGYKLDVKGAGGTWDSGICTSGGLIKNIWVTGSFRGVFVKGADHTEKIVLDNVRIEGTTYTISIDQASYQGLEAKNSIFRGWTSYAATIGEVKFDTCTFGAGNGYNFSRPYAPTQYVNCTFEAGHQMDPRAAVTFENCTIGGVALTAENLATLVTSNIANASVK